LIALEIDSRFTSFEQIKTFYLLSVLHIFPSEIFIQIFLLTDFVHAFQKIKIRCTRLIRNARWILSNKDLVAS
jgi:hypothetical protein